MNILRWLFNRNETIKDVARPKSTRGTWKRCAGTGKTMMNMHKVEGQWFGTCSYCLKVPTLATKRAVAWPHKEMTSKA